MKQQNTDDRLPKDEQPNMPSSSFNLSSHWIVLDPSLLKKLLFRAHRDREETDDKWIAKHFLAFKAAGNANPAGCSFVMIKDQAEDGHPRIMPTNKCAEWQSQEDPGAVGPYPSSPTPWTEEEMVQWASRLLTIGLMSTSLFSDQGAQFIARAHPLTPDLYGKIPGDMDPDKALAITIRHIKLGAQFQHLFSDWMFEKVLKVPKPSAA